MADKPTPPRQLDPRLSNLVLEGGRQKAYPPSNVIPPPGPDVDLYGHPRTDRPPHHPYDLADMVTAWLVGLMVGAFIASVLAGCH